MSQGFNPMSEQDAEMQSAIEIVGYDNVANLIPDNSLYDLFYTEDLGALRLKFSNALMELVPNDQRLVLNETVNKLSHEEIIKMIIDCQGDPKIALQEIWNRIG